MKKCFAIAVAALTVFAACTKEGGVKTPSVSFETALPLTVDGASVLSIKVSDYSGSEAVTVPVTFSGDAEKDKDYTVSAEAFVIGGSEPVTSITVTPVVYGSKKSVTASLGVPEGFTAGSYVSCTFPLSDAVARCSFATSSATLVNSLSIEVNLIGNDDKAYAVQNVEEIAVEVDTENSTAVEGTDFRFKDDKKAVVFDAMKSTGKLEIEYIETADNAGKTVVLKLAPSSKYEIGQYGSITVKLLGSFLGKLGGTWVIDELVTTADFIEEGMGWAKDYSSRPEEEVYAGFPEFNANDSFTFSIEDETFSPAFQSSFKNYFIGTSKVSLAGTVPLSNYAGISRNDCQMLLLDNVNRYFSATEFSEDKEGIIALRFNDSGEYEVLELYVIDYESKTFLSQELVDFGCYASTKPVLAAMTYAYLLANFKRAE